MLVSGFQSASSWSGPQVVATAKQKSDELSVGLDGDVATRLNDISMSAEQAVRDYATVMNYAPNSGESGSLKIRHGANKIRYTDFVRDFLLLENPDQRNRA